MAQSCRSFIQTICVWLGVRGGQQPAERVEGWRKDWIALGESLRRAEWEVLAASAKPHAACVIVALLPAHAPPFFSQTPRSTCTHRHLTSTTFELLRNRPNKIRVKKTDGEQKVWQTSKFSSYFTLSCPHFRRTPDWNNKSTNWVSDPWSSASQLNAFCDILPL